MVVSIYFGGESHLSTGQSVSFKEPCYTIWIHPTTVEGAQSRSVVTSQGLISGPGVQGNTATATEGLPKQQV